MCLCSMSPSLMPPFKKKVCYSNNVKIDWDCVDVGLIRHGFRQLLKWATQQPTTEKKENSNKLAGHKPLNRIQSLQKKSL